MLFVTLLKETSSYTFLWEIFKISQSIIFLNLVICVEEGNYVKDYMKLNVKPRKGRLFHFFALSAR